MFTSKTKMASGWRTPWKLSSPLDKQQPVSRATVLDTRLPEGEQVRPAGWRPSQDGLGLEVGGRALRPSLAGICFRHTDYKKIVPKRISLNLWKKKKKRRVCAQAIEPRTRAQQGRKPAFPTSWEHPGRGVRSEGDLAGPPLSAWWLAEQRGHATHGLVQPSVPRLCCGNVPLTASSGSVSVDQDCDPRRPTPRCPQPPVTSTFRPQPRSAPYVVEPRLEP